MEDLKQYLKLDNKKLRKCLNNENKLKKLNMISNDFNFWKKQFTYDSERSNLENFLLYRVAGAWNLFEKIDDADITPQALKYLKKRLSLINEVKDVKIGKSISPKEKQRTFLIKLNNGEKIYLESDTANSLMYDLGIFFRIVLAKLYGKKWHEETYIKYYDLGDYAYYQPYKLYYFYTLVEKLKTTNQLSKEENECLKALELRAKYTHIKENMILVPYGYNKFRGGFRGTTYSSQYKIEDRLDLTFMDFQEMLKDKDFNDEKLHKRLQNEKCNIESIKFLIKNKELLFPKIPHYKNNVKDNTVKEIRENSENIVKSLREK